MLASILWQGSLPDEEEIYRMKEAGYHFVEQADGFRICLSLDPTPSGNYYADSFSKEFRKEVELHEYLAEIEKKSAMDHGSHQKDAGICYRPSG